MLLMNLHDFQESFTSDEKATIFGNNATVETAMHFLLDKDSDGMVFIFSLILCCCKFT